MRQVVRSMHHGFGETGTQRTTAARSTNRNRRRPDEAGYTQLLTPAGSAEWRTARQTTAPLFRHLAGRYPRRYAQTAKRTAPTTGSHGGADLSCSAAFARHARHLSLKKRTSGAKPEKTVRARQHAPMRRKRRTGTPRRVLQRLQPRQVRAEQSGEVRARESYPML